MEGKVEALFRNPSGILSSDAPGNDIAISSRVRLARNPADRMFPLRESEDERREFAAEVAAAVPEIERLGGADALVFDPEHMGAIEREVLLERYLASREFNARPEGALLAVRPDERASIMVNEDDALRIQCLRPGFQLDEAWEEASALDDELGSVFKYAFDEKLGFLTADPTNVGTGMRASVMLHLPGLVLTNQIASAVAAVGKLNIAVRGLYGEGSENLGNMYQVSNQSTLGESEKQIIDRLGAVVSQLVEREENTRKLLMERDQHGMLDVIGRSYGVLKHSHRLSSEEALKCLSGVRLGVDMRLFKSLDVDRVNTVFMAISPAHLQKRAGRELDQSERDVCRAAFCREHLN
ncbi:MAG: protein arginine kinase [Lentisphaeria bacterium]|nr:protein arginine kinase [Lentisphaeria bacterium]